MHGVLGLLEQRLLGAQPDLARQLITRQRLSQMQVVAVEREVLAAFPADMRVVLLKGPALSERLYGDPFRRASRDLDLLLAGADLDRCADVLRGLGFEIEAAESEAYHREHHHHLTFVRMGAPPIELHFRLITGFGTAISGEEFLARSLAYRSESVRILAPEDEFLYLGVHAAQHQCGRLIWLEDVRRLRESRSDLDMDHVQRRASEYRVRRPLEFTLEVLRGDLRRWRRFQAVERSALPEAVRELVLGAVLCDSPKLAWRHLSHHSGRMMRRRSARVLPALTPKSWAS